MKLETTPLKHLISLKEELMKTGFPWMKRWKERVRQGKVWVSPMKDPD